MYKESKNWRRYAPPPKKTNPLVAKFRKMADALTDKIEDMRAPMTQNSTPKREAQRQSKLADANHLERTQTALRALAHELEAWGCVPLELAGLTSKKAIHDLLYTRFENRGHYNHVDTGEYTNTTPAALALYALIAGDNEEQKARQEKERIEATVRQLAGEIDGFYPTPDNIIERMIGGIPSGADVLEPSAGAGNICDMLPDAKLTLCEANYTLRELLESKGYTIAEYDFLDYEGTHDYIVMNPPFERGQDMQHIQHAYNCLNEGGRLVSVVSAGILNGRGDKFRAWLDDVGGWYEELPAESFKESGTNVSTCLVTIDK